MKPVNPKILLSLIFILGLVLGYYAISADPFLNLWDERFHALVAKNMMDAPLKPTLYKSPVLELNNLHWDQSHIWLHKQPLFLWQMMISLKLFGINEFAVRLPSALLNGLLVLIAYGIGSMVSNRRVGLLAALLYATSFYMLLLVSGRKELEHNDIAFLFYISASIWAWLKYLQSKHPIYLILTGILSGAAVLCKWLSGLIVYLAWAVYILSAKNFKIRQVNPLILSILVSFLVFMPWQVYIFLKYPIEARHEFIYNSKHIYEVIEGHSGSFWFHIVQMKELFGRAAQILILPAAALFLFRYRFSRLAISFLSVPLFLYLFYSLAATKMPSYPLPAAMPILVIFSFFIIECIGLLMKYVRKKWINIPITMIVLLTLVWFNLRLTEFNRIHDPGSELAMQLVHNKEVFQKLGDELPGNSIVLNVNGRHYIECMFYSGLTSYGFIPSHAACDSLIDLGYVLAVFDNGQLPGFLDGMDNVILIPEKLRGQY